MGHESAGSFFEGVMLGLGAAVPIGPVNLLIMGAALTRFGSGLLIGLGAMSADVTYLLLIVFGVFAAFGTPLFLDAVSLLGGLFLLSLAWLIFSKRNQPLNAAAFAPGGVFKTWLQGYLVTLLSPYTIAFWVSASTFATTHHAQDTAWMLGGMIAAIGLWIVFLPAFVYRSRGLLSPRLVRVFALLSSAVLVWIGARLLFKLFYSH